MILLQIRWIQVVLMVAYVQWRWLWVAVEVAGVLGLLIFLKNIQIIGLWCFFFFFFGSEVYYFIVVDILFYCDVYIILLC